MVLLMASHRGMHQLLAIFVVGTREQQHTADKRRPWRTGWRGSRLQT
jgi:hypothetical protein